MRSILCLAVFVLACGPDTDSDTDTSSLDSSDSGDDTSTTEQTLEHTCGQDGQTENYTFRWPAAADFEIGSTPKVTTWFVYTEAYLDAVESPYAATFNNDGALDNTGRLIGSCVWYTTAEAFMWDLRLVLGP